MWHKRMVTLDVSGRRFQRFSPHFLSSSLIVAESATKKTTPNRTIDNPDMTKTHVCPDKRRIVLKRKRDERKEMRKGL